MLYGSRRNSYDRPVGAAGCSRTSLIEALVHKGGALHIPGSVERSTTVCDFDPLDHKYRHSLTTAITHLHFLDTRIYLLDAAGYPYFSGLSMSRIAAVETAAIVIHAQRIRQVWSERWLDR